MSFRDDELILNYEDAVVYGRDLKILDEDCCWLNSSIVWFQFQRLQKNQVTFMDPSVLSFFMHQLQDEEDIEEFASSVASTKILVLAINDAMESNSAVFHTGSHWSLLVYDQSSWNHFDSLKSHNTKAAQAVVAKFNAAWHNNKASRCIEWDVPQQTNGYDCGIHMLAAAQCVTDTFVALHVVEELQNRFTEIPEYCLVLRKQIADDILSLCHREA